MKKLFAIAFTCVYLTLAVGVVQTTHYCLGRVKSSSLFSFETTKCPCYLFARTAKNCCSDEHDIIKIEDDHAASSVVSVAPAFFEIATLFDLTPIHEVAFGRITHAIEESPPPPDKVPLFTKHCSLVFYDADVIG